MAGFRRITEPGCGKRRFPQTGNEAGIDFEEPT
jgi:hypothetical protein